MFRSLLALLTPVVGLAMFPLAPTGVAPGAYDIPLHGVDFTRPLPGYDTVSEATIQQRSPFASPSQEVAFTQPLPRYGAVSEVTIEPGAQPGAPYTSPSRGVAFTQPLPGYGTVSEVTIQPSPGAPPYGQPSTGTSVALSHPSSTSFPWCATVTCWW
jgi:hypothetical protein